MKNKVVTITETKNGIQIEVSGVGNKKEKDNTKTTTGLVMKWAIRHLWRNLAENSPCGDCPEFPKEPNFCNSEVISGLDKIIETLSDGKTIGKDGFGMLSDLLKNFDEFENTIGKRKEHCNEEGMPKMSRAQGTDD